jgi:hypothetical protein
MRIRLKNRLRSWAGAAVLAACAAGVVAVPHLRADDEKIETPAPRFTTYIGELKNAPESARIALVVEESKFVAYVCSADQEFNNTFSRWLRGDVKDGQLSGTAGGIELTATLKGDTVSGSIKKDKVHEFIAKAIPGDANAGLFRASETFNEDDYIVGWIIDEKGNVVGTGGRRGGPVQTLQPPKGNNDLRVVAGKKDGAKSAPLQPGRVTGAGTGAAANNTGKKLDDAARNEILQDLIAERRAVGGDAIHAMIIHQVRRFTSGKKPQTKLEEKTFAALRAAPKGSLETYLKNWDALPKASRDALLGPAANQLDPNKGLDAQQGAQLVKNMAQLRTVRNAAPRSGIAGTIKGVSIPTVKCVDETNPEVIGKDEIFAIHTVIQGEGDPQVKRTGLLTGFDDGVSKNFASADASVFPLPGQTPTDGDEVLVVSTLYEDDGTGVVAALNFLKPIIQVAVIVVIDSFRDGNNKLNELEKAAIKLAVDAAIKAVSGPLSDLLVQPLGTDSIVILPDGSVTSENGGNKTRMRFRKVKNGDVRFDYELTGFAVQR